MRAWLARRMGRFLGVTDLSRSVGDLQAALAHVAAQLATLEAGTEELARHQHDLGRQLDVWAATASLAATSQRAGASEDAVAEDTLVSVVLTGEGDTPAAERSIASVQAQTHANWELLVTGARFDVRGELVAFLAPGFVMHPDWLRALVRAHRQSPDAEVLAGARVVDDELRARGLGAGGSPRLLVPDWDAVTAAIGSGTAEVPVVLPQLALHARVLPSLGETAGRSDDELAQAILTIGEPRLIAAIAVVEHESAPRSTAEAQSSHRRSRPTRTEDPLVSVITPFFNAAPFLEEAITSVLDQSYPRVELLLVDDGSTDGSDAIARRFAERHPERVRHLAHPRGENRGEGATRNLGMRSARGEWIAFVDADDVWLPHKLDTQLALAFDHPEVASVWGPMEFWPPRVHSGELQTLRDLRVETDRVWQAPELALRFIEGSANTPGVISALVRREVVQTIGGYDELLPLFADQVFFVRLCLKADVYVHHEPLEKYRQHPDSACARAEDAGLYDPLGGASALHRRYLDRLELHLRADRVTDPRVWAALSRARAPYRTESTLPD